MTIDWNRPVQTRDGRKVRVLCTDGPAKYPVVGLIESSPWDTPDYWDGYGRFAGKSDSNLDLINAPEPEREIVRWVNVYPDDGVSPYFYRAKGAADDMKTGRRIACVPVTIRYRPGQGLEE